MNPHQCSITFSALIPETNKALILGARRYDSQPDACNEWSIIDEFEGYSVFTANLEQKSASKTVSAETVALCLGENIQALLNKARGRAQ